MNLRKLKIFLTVCECGSMSGAAKKLYMTQPAISQAILELEDELKVNLFDRIKKKLVLTYPGEILYEYSKRILMLIDEAQNTIKDISHMNMGRLRIGASTTIGTYLLPELIGEFKKKYKNIEIHFLIDNTGVIEKKILDYEIDIGLVEGPIHSKEIIVKPFFDDELYLICSKDHHWASRKSVKPEEIKDENLIIREPGSGTREVIENTMAKYNLSYHIKHVLNNTEAIIKAVEANIGISIVPKIAVKEKIKSGNLIKINLENICFKRKFNIIYHKDKYRPTLFNEFIEYLNSFGN
ncbi:transcriptional regulator [Anoxybacter fermentans]|uniref:Transcriptional regulator n=1 Tax=Anoxybacter fermentans TaxID=1323375 RepID=A0A3S9SY99_9FIRM|nr:selenium metabolism-associated LysR family transcriptional regulator [Anoxybacter fermentans]AZR73224.1 transcriptional regulator [Anoxybacter fermentans]